MGKLINGINGPVIGKVGSVIGSSRNGQYYIKGQYKKRTKKISAEEGQNRSKFAIAQFWLKPIVDYVREGFKGYSIKSQGFIAAKSHLLLNAFEGVQPNISINPALAKVSSGNLPLASNISVELVSADKAFNELKFTWTYELTAGITNAKDQAMLLAYDAENGQAFFTTFGQFRYTGEDVLRISPKKGRTYQVYLAFTAFDRSRQSDSCYLGAVST